MGNDDYDRRRKTPCGCCMSAFKWIPVIFIAAVIGWSYYAYVVELCILATESRLKMALFLAFYHVSLALFLWSYWQTIFTPVGRVPEHWRIPDSEVAQLFRADNPEAQKRILNNFARNLPVTNRTMNGSVRFCEKCKIIKPDRSHHCSVCNCCVLKMDHHCPWVNNCVNFFNYKFFVLFLGYALIYCLYVALTTLGDFVLFWKTENEYLEQGQLNGTGAGRFHILFLFFIAVMFAISLVSLFGYHIYLVLMNRTTLEAFRAPIFRVGGPDKNGYNLGRYANFCEVFGDDWHFWFLPIFTSNGDGLEYPTATDQRNGGRVQRYDAMGNTQASPLDGQPTDKLIDAIPAINAQVPAIMHDPLAVAHAAAAAATPPSQVIVNLELKEDTKTVAAALASPAAEQVNGAAVVIDIIGDQQRDADKAACQLSNGDAKLAASSNAI